MLKQEQTLENFIIAKSNQLAYMAIKDKLEFNTLDNSLIL